MSTTLSISILRDSIGNDLLAYLQVVFFTIPDRTKLIGVTIVITFNNILVNGNPLQTYIYVYTFEYLQKIIVYIYILIYINMYACMYLHVHLYINQYIYTFIYW